MAFISYWSSQSHVPIESPWWEEHFYGWQSVAAHACAFGIFGALLRWGFGRGGHWWQAAAIASICGALDEWHQSFTPDRDVELSDWITDTLAGTTCSVAVSVFLRRAPVPRLGGTSLPRVVPPLQVSRGLSFVAVAATAALLTFTPVGHPARAVARTVAAHVVPTRVQVAATDLGATTYDLARRAKNRVVRLLDG
jgi:VanZ family protein